MDVNTKATANRSLRTVKVELVYLNELGLLDDAKLEAINNLLPSDASAFASPGPIPLANPSATSLPASIPAAAPYTAHAGHPAEPPAYSTPPPGLNTTEKPLAMATAMYDYTESAPGDLNFRKDDTIAILQYANQDWWKGRNTRTGEEGIFPHTYVRINEDTKSQAFSATPQYHNGEFAPSSSVAVQGNETDDKMKQHGKKFGKKLGNAAIFGAGATIGSNIVNSIF